jgi:hypothetical protein
MVERDGQDHHPEMIIAMRITRSASPECSRRFPLNIGCERTEEYSIHRIRQVSDPTVRRGRSSIADLDARLHQRPFRWDEVPFPAEIVTSVSASDRPVDVKDTLRRIEPQFRTGGLNKILVRGYGDKIFRSRCVMMNSESESRLFVEILRCFFIGAADQ